MGRSLSKKDVWIPMLGDGALKPGAKLLGLIARLDEKA
jgi:hypothetical protein